MINRYLPEPTASLMNGIIFGVPLDVSDDFYTQLKRVGLLHLVVLSGMNITFLAAIIRNLTLSLPKKISAAISIGVIVAFILFVGPQPPIVRAGITGVVGLLAVIYERRKLALYSLFLSALFIFIFKREWITGVSFQLSFGATLGIILFGPRQAPQRKIGIRPHSKLVLFIKDDLRTSLAAQVFTAPIIFIYFQQVSLIAPVANVLVGFIVAPLMVLGFLAAILGKIHYVAGIVPVYLSYGLLVYMTRVISFLDKLPGIFIQF